MWQIFADAQRLRLRLHDRPRSSSSARPSSRVRVPREARRIEREACPTARRCRAPSGSTSASCCSSARRCRCCSSASSSAPSSSSSGCWRSTRPRASPGSGPTSNVLLTISIGGDDFELTEELLRVAGGLAAFSGFYFAVAMLTDSTYREEFLEELTDEMQVELQGAGRLPRAAGAERRERDDDRGLPAPARATTAARPRCATCSPSTGSRSPRRWRSGSAPGSASTTCRSTASRRRGSPTAGSGGSRSSSSSSPGSPLRLRDVRRPRCSLGGGARGGRRRPAGAPAHRPLLPRPLRQLGALPRPRGRPRRLRRRGRLPLRHRLRGAADDAAREPRRARATASTRCSRSTATCSTVPDRRRARRPARRGAAAIARNAAADDRAGDGRVRGAAGAAALRRRGRRAGRSSSTTGSGRRASATR